MFTGLIEATAKVTRRDISSLWVNLSAFEEGAETGASIAINGVCLTVAGKKQRDCRFDVSEENPDQDKLD